MLVSAARVAAVQVVTLSRVSQGRQIPAVVVEVLQTDLLAVLAVPAL